MLCGTCGTFCPFLKGAPNPRISSPNSRDLGEEISLYMDTFKKGLIVPRLPQSVKGQERINPSRFFYIGSQHIFRRTHICHIICNLFIFRNGIGIFVGQISVPKGIYPHFFTVKKFIQTLIQFD